METRWHAYLRKVLRAGAGCFLVFGLARTGLAADTPCARTVHLAGASDLVPVVLSLLRQHGVASDSGCSAGAVRAWLQRDAGASGHWLHIEDGFGRTSDRRVSDARTAASLIETWTLGEDAALLSPRAASVPVPAATAVVGGAAAGVPRWQVAAAVELSTDLKANALWGGGARACGRVGAACIGGRARAAAGNESTNILGTDIPGANIPGTDLDVSRRDLEVAVTALFPATWPRFTLTPVLALGVGWQRTTARDAAMRTAAVDPAMSSWTDVSFLVQPSLMGGVRLGAGWSLVAEAGLSLAAPVSDGGSELQHTYVPRRAPITVRTAVGLEFAR